MVSTSVRTKTSTSTTEHFLLGVHGVGRQARGDMAVFFDAVTNGFERDHCREILYQDLLDGYAGRVDLGPVAMRGTGPQRLFRDFAGDGIGIDGDLVEEQIVNRIWDEIRRLTKSGARRVSLTVFAHSLGTVNTWRALRRLGQQSPAFATFTIRDLFLAGSPLRYYLARRLDQVGDATSPAVTGRIVNFVDIRDPIIAARGGGLGDIEGVTDVIVRNRPRLLRRIRPSYCFTRHAHYHVGYAENSIVIAMIRESLRGHDPIRVITR